MLCSLVTPGQAGKYEDAFIEEMNNGARQLQCRKGPDKAHYTYKDRVPHVVGTSRTLRGEQFGKYGGRDNIITEHIEYRWEQVAIHPRPNPIINCTTCGHTMVGNSYWPWAGMGAYPRSFSFTPEMDTLTIEPDPDRAPERMTRPCRHPSVVGRLRDICARAPAITFQTNDWRTCLTHLWYTARVLDAEAMISPSEKKPDGQISVVYGGDTGDTLTNRCILL